MTNEKTREVLQEQIDRYGQEYDAEGIEALETAIKLVEQTRWIPVSERYPIIGQDVLISKGDFVLIDTFCYDSIDETYYFYNYDDVEAWMPLPTSYQGGEER